jgi:2-dehydropantoate 2-reductase
LPDVAVWGDGAVGTALSVILAGAGREVVLVGPPGSGTGGVELTAAGAFEGSARIVHMESDRRVDADLSLVAVKAFDLSVVSATASRAGGVVCATNGLGLEREWAGDWTRVERIVLTSGYRLTGPGSVETFPGSIHLEEGGFADSAFGPSAPGIERHPDIEPVVWAKWLVNSVLNPFGALTGAENDRLPGLGLEHSMNLVFEELSALVPGKYGPSATTAAREMLRHLTSHSGNRCSMLQDLDRGSRTEIDFMTGYAETAKPGSCPLARLLTDLVKGLAASPA